MSGDIYQSSSVAAEIGEAEEPDSSSMALGRLCGAFDTLENIERE